MAGVPTAQDVVVEDTVTNTIFYSGNWSQRLDPSFHGGSMQISFDTAASVSFSFTGEQFWYYSDLNYDHGDCSISLDGVIVQPSLSTYSATLQYAKLLYGQAVEPGSHTVTITSLNAPKPLTVDYFVYRPVSNELPDSQDIMLRPDSPSITYVPASGAWSSSGGLTPDYRETAQQGAYFSFSFEGTYVWFQWTQNIDHGVYSVSVDGGAASNFSAYNPVWISNPMILYSRALDPGPHTLTFTNVQAGGNRLGAVALFYRPVRQATTQSKNASAQTPISNAASPRSSTDISSTTTSLSETYLSLSSQTFLSVSAPSPAPTSDQATSPVAGGNNNRTMVTGAVLGSAVCIVFGVLAVIYIRRRRNRRRQVVARNDASDTNMSEVEAYSVDPLPQSWHIFPWTDGGEDRTSGPGSEGLPRYSERDSRSHELSFAQNSTAVNQPKLRLKR